MDLVVPKMKNRQIEIEHGGFKPLADDQPTSRRPTCDVNMSKRTQSENIHNIGLKNYLFI